MAFSVTDLSNIEAAILALATGTRVVSVTINGKTMEYGAADLNQLESLRRTIASEVNAAAGKARFVLTRSSKGL